MHTGRMSRMRTSVASLLWARPAMWRACSSEGRAGSGPFFAARLAPVQAELRDPGGHRPWGEAVEPLARVAGPRRDGDARELEHAVRVLPVEEVAELVGAEQEERVVPATLAEHVDGALVLVELDPMLREGGPRKAEPRFRVEVDPLVPRPRRDQHDELVVAEIDLVAPLRSCLLQRVLELLLVRELADDAEAAIGAVDPIGRPAVGPRPVDEEVDELVGGDRSGRLSRHELEEGAPELSHAGSRRAREREDAQDPRVVEVERRHLRNEVDLVQDDDLGPLLQAGAVGGELAVYGREPVLDAAGGRVDHVNEQARALEVCEELMPEADALAGTLDQAGHVRDRQLAPVGRIDRAEHRGERRERVFGHLRPRVRDAGEERRLTGVRQPDERGVGEELQPQLERGLLAGETRLREAWRLPRRRGEAAVPAPARAAAGEEHPAAGRGEIGHHAALVVEDLRPDRNPQLDVVAVRAVLLPAAPVTAATGREPLLAREPRQVAAIRVGDDHDVPAMPAVPAVRSALRDVLLAPEAERAVPAAAGPDADLGPIVEHRWEGKAATLAAARAHRG